MMTQTGKGREIDPVFDWMQRIAGGAQIQDSGLKIWLDENGCTHVFVQDLARNLDPFATALRESERVDIDFGWFYDDYFGLMVYRYRTAEEWQRLREAERRRQEWEWEQQEAHDEITVEQWEEWEQRQGLYDDVSAEIAGYAPLHSA